MIIGIGCDLSTISRFEKTIGKKHGVHFLNRVFSQSERELFGEDAQNTARMAANFSAKEAFAKATGFGLSGFDFCEVMALRKSSGAPYYKFSGKAEKFMQENGYTAHLSLSHEGDTAMAYCVLEKNLL